MGVAEHSDIFRKAVSNRLSGVKVVNLFGYNAATSNSQETVWPTGATYAQLTTAVAFEAISSDATDDSGNNGANTISVDLVDGNYAQTTVTVTMDGLTPVAISGTYVACNGIRVLTAGSTKTNAGTITIRTVAGSVAKRTLSATINQDSNFIYTIPANSFGILSDISLSFTDTTDDATTFVRLANSSGVYADYGARDSEAGRDGTIFFGDGLRVPEKTLIELRSVMDANAGIVRASGQLFIVNVDYSSTTGYMPNGFGI